MSSLRNIDVTPMQHALSVRRNLRIVQLSDLHVGWYTETELITDWVERTNAQKPDIVVITGDFLDGWFRKDKRTLEPLAQLNAPLGVWAVTGNHDRTCFTDSKAFQHYLSTLNIQLLVNDWVSPRDDLVIIGAQDYTDHFDQGKVHLTTWLEQLNQELTILDDQRNYRHARILLIHNPDFLPLVATQKSHFDLILCGHTHGGQIHLPKLGPIYTSSRYGTRFVAGWQEEFRAYISRGLGVTSLPIRWNCPAELVVWELEPDVPV